jgi:hypothetical protein
LIAVIASYAFLELDVREISCAKTVGPTFIPIVPCAFGKPA